ncbi:ribonuclease inhibitor [Algoriphagus sp. oki45]|uniref:c-type cytochrome domain-containing protein n=1 Tax=Algoriphagus sp. oki45 TaxID=3067294 RepID=UPI0027F63B63|nr:ribonuclease inhibitor [Algoriphagus sp. oki45]
MLSFFLPLLGRFHPILVHLPIGILVFAVILIFLSKKQDKTFLPAIQLAFLLGSIGGVLACISGFLQYQFEGFSLDTVQFHLIFGILTTAAGFFFYRKSKKTNDPSTLKWSSTALIGALLFTGHLGGTITHGEGYFTEVMPEDLQSLFGGVASSAAPLTLPEHGWEELAYYEEVVQPILNSNCQSCHNPRNKKGGLDLSSKEALLKGGENGPVIDFHQFFKSNLIARMELPRDHEDHMPPREKRQPKKEELQLLRLWLENEASFDLKLGAAKPEMKILEPFFQREEIAFYPTINLPSVAEDSLSKLRKKGFYVEPIAQGSPLLKVSCINFPDFKDSDWHNLEMIAQWIAYLDLSGTQLSDSILEEIADAPYLTVLKLNRTPIQGIYLEQLSKLPHLKLIYLNETNVTLSNTLSLASSKSIQKVFAYNTSIANEIEADSKSRLPFALEVYQFDLPMMATDTIVY